MNKHPYKLYKKLVGGFTHYYVSFHDGQAQHTIAISRVVCAELLRSIRQERRLRRWDERHTIKKEFSDGTLIHAIPKASHVSGSDFVEKLIHEQNHQILFEAIDSLSELHRRRVVLYFFKGWTYDQIAEKEGCSKMPVQRSIVRALEKIKIYFESRGYF